MSLVKETVKSEKSQSDTEQHEEVPSGGEMETASALPSETSDREAIMYRIEGPGGNVRNVPVMKYDVVSVINGGELFHSTEE